MIRSFSILSMGGQNLSDWPNGTNERNCDDRNKKNRGKNNYRGSTKRSEWVDVDLFPTHVYFIKRELPLGIRFQINTLQYHWVPKLLAYYFLWMTKALVFNIICVVKTISEQTILGAFCLFVCFFHCCRTDIHLLTTNSHHHQNRCFTIRVIHPTIR